MSMAAWERSGLHARRHSSIVGRAARTLRHCAGAAREAWRRLPAQLWVLHPACSDEQLCAAATAPRSVFRVARRSS
jgi:hypothetical protein